MTLYPSTGRLIRKTTDRSQASLPCNLAHSHHALNSYHAFISSLPRINTPSNALYSSKERLIRKRTRSNRRHLAFVICGKKINKLFVRMGRKRLPGKFERSRALHHTTGYLSDSVLFLLTINISSLVTVSYSFPLLTIIFIFSFINFFV